MKIAIYGIKFGDETVPYVRKLFATLKDRDAEVIVFKPFHKYLSERMDLGEVGTFDGHNDERNRGIRVLTQAELKKGDVSLSYVSRLMNRSFPDTPRLRRVLQCIWHQINNGQDIFVVGQILDDDTVKGGTGWGAELARVATTFQSSGIGVN